MIERELAKEIGLLRETHSKNLQGTDGNAIDHVFLGKVGKDFSFSDLKAKVVVKHMKWHSSGKNCIIIFPF